MIMIPHTIIYHYTLSNNHIVIASMKYLKPIYGNGTQILCKIFKINLLYISNSITRAVIKVAS